MKKLAAAGVVTGLLIVLTAYAWVQTRAPQSPRPIRVGILVYAGVFNTEFIAPLDIFNHASGQLNGQMEVFTVSPVEGPVRTAEGLRVLADYTFDTVPEIDWLVVPSGENYLTDIEDRTLVDWISGTGDHASVIHSNCWGAFLLAAAGLLDGRKATTYPDTVDDFAARFPKIDVQRESMLVDDGGAVTTAGGVISYDGALYLVEKHFGRALATSVASGLVIDWPLRRAELDLTFD